MPCFFWAVMNPCWQISADKANQNAPFSMCSVIPPSQVVSSLAGAAHCHPENVAVIPGPPLPPGTVSKEANLDLTASHIARDLPERPIDVFCDAQFGRSFHFMGAIS